MKFGSNLMNLKWGDVFFAKLQVLLGERAPKADSAVRWRDLGEVYNTTAIKAESVATVVADAAVAEAVVPITVDLAVVTANIAANVAATDAAQLELDQLTNGLVMGLDGALASMEATQITLASSIGTVSDSVQGYQIILDALADGTIGTAVTVALNGAAIGQANTLKITEGATARVTSAPPNGFTVTIPQPRALLLSGQRIKIGILAKAPPTGAATKFGIVFASADGTSTYLVASANLTTSWQWFTFYYNVPAAATGGVAYLSIFGDDSKTGKATIVARAYIDVAAVAGELPEISNLEASVTDIRALDISALTGTAFATFLTQLSVAAGGLSGFVTTTGSAVTTLNNHAAASYTLRVGAGGASAGFEVVAADDPILGTASTIKLSAKHVEVLASSMRLSDSANLYPDFDMIDPLFYSSTTAAVYNFYGTSLSPLGAKYVVTSVSAAIEKIETGWFAIEPSTEYLVTAAAWTEGSAVGSGTSTVTFETGSVNNALVVTTLSSTTVKATTDAVYNVGTSFGNVTVVSGSTARRGRFVITRAAGGTAASSSSGFKVQKKAGATLIVDGSISARHVKAGSMSADDIKTGTMDAQNLTVTQLLKISTGTGALSVGKNSAFDLTNDGIFFGRTLEAGGAYGFGLLAGKKIGGVDQYIQATTQTGLKLVNANHYVSGLADPAAVNVTTSQTITLPVGTKILDLEYLGGGGGGAGATNSSSETVIVAGNGGSTVIQLWDGAVNTGISWTATGGLGATAIHAGDGGYAGANSALGTGGAGGAYSGAGTGAGGIASGYGAGGGGGGGTEKGGNGGGASALISVNDYDISALAAPKLVITIGAAGAGSAGQSGAGAGAAGSPGIVKYTAKTLTQLPASVLPLQPTYTGTLSKAASSVLVFPDYGAGLWCLSADGTTGISLFVVETHVDGSTIRLSEMQQFASFISDKTPIDLVLSTVATSYTYQFYKLGNWV